MTSLYHEVYDLVYGCRDASGDVRQLMAKMELVQGHSALDFGCGSGLYTAALRPYFGRVLGYDIEPECETRFRQNAPTAEFLRELPTIESVDAVFSFFNVFNYILPGSSAQGIARRLAQVSRPMAWLVLDLLQSEAMLPGTRSNEVRVGISGHQVTYRQSMTLRDDRRMEFLETLVDHGGQSIVKQHDLWLWREDELEDVLVNTGFSYRGSMPSSFLRPNQVRLVFRRAA